MVLEIRLSNFFSIKDEIAIDFRAANLKSAQARELGGNIVEQGRGQVLKTLLLYGANASGKSNIIKAIRFCNAMIVQSHNHNENSVFSFMPFKFGDSEQKPSAYFIRFLLNGVEHEYSFSLSRTAILTESLRYYPKGRVKEIFSRDERKGPGKREKYAFNDVIRRPFDVAENTSPKTLYISRASQMDRELAKEIFNFFDKAFVLNYLNFGISAIQNFTHENKSQLLEALAIADSDILDLRVKVLKTPVDNIHVDLASMTLKVENVVQEHAQILTYHKANPEVPFDFLLEESQGTIKLFFIMLTLLDVIANDKILLIDEIEESLHPRLIDYIFNLFHAGQGAQLLCATHSTHLLDLKKFRKDQIYFANKGDDGATDLYSLHDYSDFRETMDLAKAYLQGRFDAVPMVDDSPPQINRLLYGTTTPGSQR